MMYFCFISNRTPIYSSEYKFTPSPGFSPMTPGTVDYSPRTPGSPLDIGIESVPAYMCFAQKPVVHVHVYHTQPWMCNFILNLLLNCSCTCTKVIHLYFFSNFRSDHAY